MLQLGVIWLGLLAAGVPQSELWTAEGTLPLNAVERALLEDSQDGKLDSHTLLKASLIAAGDTTSHELSLLELQFDQLRRRINLDGDPSDGDPSDGDNSDGDPSDGDNEDLADHHVARAKQLLAEMHRVILTGDYEAACSDLRKTIRSGQYNCVTATIVYQILCRTHDVDSQAVAVPAHVFSQLHDPEVDVQTTCATWLKPGKGRESASESQNRRMLNDVELVAKIYYNRGVLRLHEGNFAEAVRVLRISLLLDKNDKIADSNLLAAINNWSLAEAREGRYSSASELLSIGRTLDQNYAPLAANDLHIHQKWVQSLCRDGRFRFALVVLDEGMRRRPEAKLFDDGRYIVLRMWAVDAWSAGRLEDGFAVFEDDLAPGRLPLLQSASWSPERLREVEVTAATTAAAKLVAAGRSATAARLLSQAQRRLRDERLEKMINHLTGPKS